MRRRALLAVEIGLCGCAPTSPAATLPSPLAASATAAPAVAARDAGPATPAAAPSAPPASATAVATAPPPSTAPAGEPCGDLGCRLFDNAAGAFAAVLAEQPRLLAVGEAHAKRGTRVASATRRFTDQLLPALAGRASDLVLELMVGGKGCRRDEARVAEAERPVLERQKESNQSDFVVLARRAKALGIVPHVLHPSCDELREAAAGGADTVPRMLALTATLTTRLVERIVARQAHRHAYRLVVSYGGAMHNDRHPVAERAAWSFGPALAKLAEGRYVELDLIVPELIGDSPSWRALPWYPHYHPRAHPDKVTLYAPEPGAYVIIFRPGAH